MRFPRVVVASAATLLGAAGLSLVTAPPISASQASVNAPSATQMVSDVPSTATPSVDDGDVRSIAKVGATMVIGGNFTSVNGQTRNRIAAFTQSSGALTSFNPSVNGEVDVVVPGPNDHSVYIGGSFTQVGTTTVPYLALVDTGTGAVSTTWKPPAVNGWVNDMVVRGNRVYVVGSFTKVGTIDHKGIVALNATTGALDPFMNVQLTGRHNDSGSGAQGALGPWDLDVTADGSQLVAVGNFKYADGLLRDQVVQISLTGASAAVRTDWTTSRFSPGCFSWAFDSYVRGVSYSVDGTYFVVASTGGGVTNTLCDAAARFETAAQGTDVQPTWVSETGGDTTWGVSITNNAVYVGGHQRWANNPYGSDSAGPGAVPRPGLMALEPISGRPLKWNPGRNPPGKAVYAVLATAEGLYIGSNTDYVGNFRYVRKKIAFFPYAGGAQLASTATGSVPGAVFLGGGQGTGTTNVLYRVNTGGPAIQSTDSGPDWAGDADATGAFRNSGSNAAGWDPVGAVDGTVPASTPSAIFNSERWDPGDDTEMQWHFPAAAGTPVQVRVYLANRCTCTSTSGSRVFDVDVNGSPWLNNYDIVGAVGDQTGTMKTIDLTVPASGAIDLTWRHEVENPLVNGIEIVRTDVTPTPPSGVDNLAKVQLSTTGGSAPQAAAAGGIAWGSTRGAVMIGNTVFYGSTDGYMYRATFDGTTFGTPARIDPYHDPAWANVDNHLGGTFDGNLPTLYSQFPNVTGMAYAAGKLYYTLFGDSTLHWRWFSPDSGIVDERVNNVTSSVSFGDAGGMFITGGKLYYAVSTSGNLYSVAFDGTVSGAPTLLSGPAADGVNWKSRSLFLYAGTLNQPPTASFTTNCSGASCSVNAAASQDPDGSIASYAWQFGDGGTGSGVSTSHAYVASGNYTVTLTVTDNSGATASTTRSVSVEVPASQVSFVGAAHSAPGSAKFKAAVMPAGAAAGDQLLLFLTSANTVTWTGPTGVTGWTQVDTFTNGTITSTMWRKAATAGDLGQTVRVDDPSGFRLGTLQLVVYRGVNTATAPVTARVGDSATASHVSPTVSAPSGAWVVTYYADKSATNTAWTAPAGVTNRDTVTGDSGTTRFGSLTVDSGGPVPAGTYGGLTATTNGTSDKAAIWTVALTPA